MINENLNAEELSEELFPVILSNKAINAAKIALKNLDNNEEKNLRISIKGGGCSGLKYALNFVKKTDPFDLTMNKEGLLIVIDIFSASYLMNSKIDYIEGINGNGFKFNNPNAKKTCNCGSSFN